MLTIIDRYIAKLFIGFFLGGLVVFVTLFVTVDLMSNLMSYNAPFGSLVEYYGLFVPGVLYQMMPVACLFGTVFTLSSLSKSNELVALFSSGMSLGRVAAPILVIVALISGASFWLNDRLMPFVNQRKNYIYFVDIRKQPGLYSTVKTDRIWYRSGNVLFNIKTLQADRGTAQGLTMYYFDGGWRLIQMITADEVSLKGASWELTKGDVTLFSEDSSVPLTQGFKKKTITVGDDVRDLQKSAQSTDMLNVKELKRYITRNKESGLDTLRYEVDYHAKFSFAFAAIVMSVLGVPFSVSRQRSGGMAANVGVTLLLAFGYWAAYSSGITLGQHGAVPPVMAAWFPNVVMLSLATVFTLKRRA